VTRTAVRESEKLLAAVPIVYGLCDSVVAGKGQMEAKPIDELRRSVCP